MSSVILVTSWYATTICPHLCPNWWKRIIIDDIPTIAETLMFKKTHTRFTFRSKKSGE